MEIVTKDDFFVIGKKVSCKWKQLHKEMPLAWQEVLNRATEIKNRVTSEFLDICLELVNGNFTQLICAEVSDLHQIPDGFEGHHIPKQQYIHTKHTGPVTAMADTFQKMQQYANEHNLKIDPLDFKIQTLPQNENEGYDLYFKIVE